MHYGWPAPRQTLLTYAKEHGLILMMHRRNPPLSDESDGESSDDDISESSAEDSAEDNDRTGDEPSGRGSDESDRSGIEKTSKPLPFFIRAKGTNIDERPSMVAAMEHMFAQLSEKDGLRVPKTMDMYPTLQHGGGERQIISVFTNYHLLRKDLPSPEDVQKFGEAVGITAQPKWYIDQEKYEWYLTRDPYRR
ncbi:uncharacterized protein B0H18DRAFT_1003461 [Fomitopsis serialis]|uniref:uncharacterized protein n=1 Tax=Fomitopsis serialis TaxID=139415 RepID=UPI002007B560|nr:uncharacterized protein B0H18DRAFT_1003461 [Neoantrodia serialis]KAH9927706.1 hypothetical protein B0H18DRAFT_1003461 [Neoantrodia serialis]